MWLQKCWIKYITIICGRHACWQNQACTLPSRWWAADLSLSAAMILSMMSSSALFLSAASTLSSQSPASLSVFKEGKIEFPIRFWAARLSHRVRCSASLWTSRRVILLISLRIFEEAVTFWLARVIDSAATILYWLVTAVLLFQVWWQDLSSFRVLCHCWMVCDWARATQTNSNLSCSIPCSPTSSIYHLSASSHFNSNSRPRFRCPSFSLSCSAYLLFFSRSCCTAVAWAGSRTGRPSWNPLYCSSLSALQSTTNAIINSLLAGSTSGSNHQQWAVAIIILLVCFEQPIRR